MSAKVVDKQERRDQILGSAIRVFARKGFSRTTISDIATAAEMGKGTIYEYFGTKEEIIHHSFEFFMRHLEMDFEAVLISKMPAVSKLRTIFDGFAGFIDSHTRQMMELMFDFWSEAIKNKDTKGAIYTEMKKFYKAYREIFADIIIEGMGEGAIRKDINPRSAAAAIVGALDGIMVQWVLDQDEFDFKDVTRTIGISFLEGLLSERT